MTFMLSSTVLVFVSLCIQYAACLNSKLTTQRGSGDLTCEYIGDRNVKAVQWYNGSSPNPNPLILEQNGSDGKWYVFSKSKSPFDMNRIDYSCGSDNICTLEIKPLLPIDENVTISCTFLDPDPGEPKANATIHLKGTPGCKTLGAGEIAPIVIAVTVLVGTIILVTVIIYRKRKMNTRKFKSVSQEEETCPIKDLKSPVQQMSEQQHWSDLGQDTDMEGVKIHGK